MDQVMAPDSNAWRPGFRVRARYWISWVLVRPRRWLFHRMVWASTVRWVPRRAYSGGPISWPNPHWWILYLTVFRAFRWLQWRGWRLLVKVDDRGCYGKIPWYARAVRRIGETTAGCATGGGECWHCASKDGDPVHLSEDETGETFELLDSGPTWSDWGTGGWFRGITTCPRCGFRREYSDSSP